MKKVALVFALLFASVLTATEPLKTEFDGTAVLTDKQIQIVKELALRAGLPSVGLIYSYNIHPGPSFGINVVSREEIVGREGTSSCIAVGYEPWEPGGSKFEKVKFRSGDFWVRPWMIKTRFGIFSGRRGEMKISLSEKTTLAMADKIFALFDAGKIRFKSPELKSKVEEWRTADLTIIGINWESPDSGSVGIAVRDRHAGMGLVCTLDGGEIVVVDVIQVIS